jgi:tRNA threonylcarbamoyladenosine biosynthesis protein TsaE
VSETAWVSEAPAETEGRGERLASALRVGDVVLLIGPLGAGKTRFVTGLARGLAVHGRVRSPSFGLVHEYSGPLPLIHVDLYRLGEREADGLGLDELLERGTMVVEWGERLPAALRRDALELSFVIAGPERRAITAGAAGARGAALLEAWNAGAGAPAARPRS